MLTIEAVWVSLSPLEFLNVYFGYSEGSRSATSIELGCADPNQPCKLPNSMAGDPPLSQVVTRTWEAGVRSAGNTPLNWSFGYFIANNYNDILFVTSTQSGFGYFKNFGRTQRKGIEATLTGTLLKKVTVGGGYTLLDSTYASAETVNGSGNSSNDSGSGLEGVIEIHAGDRIPLNPRHMVKAFVNYAPFRKLSFDLNAIAMSTSYARGNENNLHQPDGVYYLGSGKSAGYGIVNAETRFEVTRHLDVTAQLTNLFNTRSATAAQLGTTGFTSDATFIARPFPSVAGELPLQQSTFFAPGPLARFRSERA